MPRRIAPSTRAPGRRVAIVVSRFNPAVGEGLLNGALRALADAGVADDDVSIATVPGALETPLALQRFAQTGDFSALVALGCVIRGETYHFEIVANESAAGVTRVSLDYQLPIANVILTTENLEQAVARQAEKGINAARVVVEMANLLDRLE